MEYSKYRYLFPPRPENKVPRSYLKEFDDGRFLAQPKFNGDCGPMFFNPEIFIPMNRHNQPLTRFKLDPNEIRLLFPNNGWNVIVGEYMAKSKKDENNKTFNHKLVIFDILVLDGEYLLGKTFEERIQMLYNMFGIENNFKTQIPSDDIFGKEKGSNWEKTGKKENEYSYQISENIWIVKSFLTDFVSIWESITKIDMIEGFVLKKRNAPLEVGYNEKNNSKSQIKFRKSCKSYEY